MLAQVEEKTVTPATSTKLTTNIHIYVHTSLGTQHLSDKQLKPSQPQEVQWNDETTRNIRTIIFVRNDKKANAMQRSGTQGVFLSSLTFDPCRR